MHLLLLALTVVLVAAALMIGRLSRRGGLNNVAARNRPEGDERRRWPTSPSGWAALLVIAGLLVEMLVVFIHTRGVWSGITTFVVIGFGTYICGRWMRGGQANW